MTIRSAICALRNSRSGRLVDTASVSQPPEPPLQGEVGPKGSERSARQGGGGTIDHPAASRPSGGPLSHFVTAPLAGKPLVSGEERLGNILLPTHLLPLRQPFSTHITPYYMAAQGASRTPPPTGGCVDARCGIVGRCMETGMYMYVSATFKAFK